MDDNNNNNALNTSVITSEILGADAPEQNTQRTDKDSLHLQEPLILSAKEVEIDPLFSMNDYGR